MGNKIPVWTKSTITATLNPSLFDYTVKDIDGVETPLSKYNKSKALVVANVASKCGLTKAQYEGLVALRQQLRTEHPDAEFEVLGFPCGQFSNQEFDDPNKIKDFVKTFNVDFPLLEKTNVNGPDTHPVFQFLKYNSEELRKGETLQSIGWNFGKFLVDGEGKVVKYYGPKVEPLTMKEDAIKVIKGEMKGKGGDQGTKTLSSH